MFITHIALANIKRRKSAALSLAILITLAAALMNIGLNFTLGAGDFFERKSEALRSPHNTILISGNLYMPEFAEYFEKDERVLRTEVDDLVFMDVATTSFGSGSTELGSLFMNADKERYFLPFSPLESADVPQDKAIYIPLGMKAGSPAPGERFTVAYKNRNFDFIVAGYFETAIMGTSNSGCVKYFLSGEAYQRLLGELGGSKLISVQLTDAAYSDQIQKDFTAFSEDVLAEDALTPFRFTYGTAKSLGMIAPGMYTAALLAFSGVILLIVMLITRFRIASNIEESMHNIGALGAMGYTSGQIIRSMLIEYLIITLAGDAAGILISLAGLPVMEELMSGSSGMVWTSSSPLLSALFCTLLTAAFVLAVALLAAARVRKLPPVVALSRGQGAHTFKRNSFPLDRAGGLLAKLSCKQAAADWKQGLVLLMIYACVSFTVILTSVLYTNIVLQKDTFLRMLGVEIADVYIETSLHTDADALADELSQKPGVRGVSMADMATIQLAGFDIMCTVSDDYSLMETLNTYEGVMPRYDNEVAITGVLSNMMGKTIGDSIELKYHGVTGEYMITGFMQSTNMMGLAGLVTLDGIRRIDPFYQRTSIDVNLEAGVSTQDFISALERQYCMASPKNASGWDAVDAAARQKLADLMSLYNVDSLQYAVMDGGELVASGSSDGYKIERIQDFKARLKSQMYALTEIISQLAQGILVFSALIIGLILFLLIRATIQKQQRLLVIYKAVGYTARQLTLVLMGSLLPAALAGAAIGMALGVFYAEPLFTLIFYSTGISSAELSVNYPLAFSLCAGILLFSAGIAMLVLRKLKKVSVYELLAD